MDLNGQQLGMDCPMEVVKEYNIMQVNGTRVYGPPLDYVGPIPSSNCELFIQNIPRRLTESDILPHFERFGKLYEFRLMMDYDNTNRGYAFLKYTNFRDAVKAMEIMNHYIFENGSKMQIRRSYNKCRLYVGKFPKILTQRELDQKFKQIFPNLHKFIMHTRVSDGDENRGYGIMEFLNHRDALDAKKQCTPGGLELFGTSLEVTWDKHNRCADEEDFSENKTLFVRNIHPKFGSRELGNLLSSRVSNSEVKKISRTRDLAFIDLTTHEAAETVKNFLNGYQLYDKVLDAEWAMPPKEDSIHYLNNCDCDAMLRMKCIANYWDIPIIIYGRYYIQEKVQCAAIVIKSKVTQLDYVYLIEMSTVDLADLQSRLCEIVIHIIRLFGNLPTQHLVIKCQGDAAEIIGHIPDLSAPEFVPALGIYELTYLHWPEFVDLSQMIFELSANSTEHLYAVYNNKVKQQETQDGFEFLDLVVNGRICGCLSSLYRKRNPLKYGLDDRVIILILCDISTWTNYLFDNDESTAEHCTSKLAKVIGKNTIPQNCIKSTQIQLFPRSFVQTNYQNTLTINKVLYGQLKVVPGDGNYSSPSQGSPTLDQFCQLSVSAPSLTPPESLIESPTATYRGTETNWYQQTSSAIPPNYLSPQSQGELLLQQAITPMVYCPAATNYVYQQQLVSTANEPHFFNIPLLQRLPYYEQPTNGYSVAFPMNQ